MEKRRQDQIDKLESRGPKAEWTKPEVDRLLAGGAEASDGADTDGADLLS